MLQRNDELAGKAGGRSMRRAARRFGSISLLLAVAVAGLAIMAGAGLADRRAAALLVLLLVASAFVLGRRRENSLTLRREARRADFAWQRALELPLAAIDEPAYILRADGAVKYQNEAARRTVGPVPPDAHLSARVRSPAILALVGRVAASGEPETVEHTEKVPSERWFQVRCAPIPDTPVTERSGRLFVLFFRDMTQARRMDRMRTDFVANASHELRTPLASLTGFIETLRGPAKDDPAARERFLEIMQDQAGRMTRLVGDLMSLSRLELKAHLAPGERVDLAELLGRVAASLRPQAHEHGVEIETELPTGPVTILGDRDELVQVFENLVENACKYGAAGGRVVVSLAVHDHDGLPDGRLAEATVRDFGPGIAPEHVPRLTERFYRVDVENSRSKNGTGLGLAIVKHILTRHRSRLIVRSRLGEGTAFSARFPVTDERNVTSIDMKSQS